MGSLFHERERAAESIYVHDEEMRFLARRRGLETLAKWAADSMAMTPEDRTIYTQGFVEAFLEGTPEADLLTQIQTHLERAGKPALSTNVSTVFAQAVAEATAAMRVAPHENSSAPSSSADARTEWSRRHPKPDHAWGWTFSH